MRYYNRMTRTNSDGTYSFRYDMSNDELLDRIGRLEDLLYSRYYVTNEFNPGDIAFTIKSGKYGDTVEKNKSSPHNTLRWRTLGYRIYR